MGSGAVAGEIRVNAAQTLLRIGRFCRPLVCCMGIASATSQSEYLRIVKDFSNRFIPRSKCVTLREIDF